MMYTLHKSVICVPRLARSIVDQIAR